MKQGELQNDSRLRTTSIRNACGANKVNTHLDLHVELLCTHACTFLRTNGKKKAAQKVYNCSQDSSQQSIIAMYQTHRFKFCALVYDAISCHPHRDSLVETCSNNITHSL